jgi:hypothetical protein
MRSSILEKWLTDQGVSFTYHPAVALTQLKVTKSARDNIRMGQTSKEHVQELKLAKKAGAEFPPLVYSKGFRECLNGLHRMEVYTEEEVEKTDVYEVDTTDQIVIEKLQRRINTIEGLPPTPAERLLHAVHLVALGQTATDSAREMGIPEGRVKDKILVQKTIIRIAQAGVSSKVAQALSERQILDVAGIQRDKHARAFAELMHEARLGAAETHQLRDEIRRARDDAAADGVIKEWRERYKDEIARVTKGLTKGPASPLRTMELSLTRGRRLIGLVDTANPKAMTVLDLRGAIKSCEATRDQLNRLLEKLRSWLRTATKHKR